MAAGASETYGDGSVAERYERTVAPIMAPFADVLLTASRVHAASAVLDVACGTGFTARAAARRVGPAGRVVGVDADADMLRAAARHGAGWAIEWTQASAQALPFPPETFDAVLCLEGMYVLTDVHLAAREAARVCRRDGCVAVAVWLPIENSPYLDAHRRIVRRFGGEQAPASLDRIFAVQAQDVGHEFLRAGLLDITIEEVTLTTRLPNAVEYVPQHLGAVPWGLALEEANPGILPRAAHALLLEVADDIDSEGVLVTPVALAVVTANP